MTTQEKIDFIREKCIDANPEIVELKFGCGVRLIEGQHGRKKGEVGIFAGAPDEAVVVFGGETQYAH